MKNTRKIVRETHKKLEEFCKWAKIDTYMRHIAIIILNKIYNHPDISKKYDKWHTAFIASFWIATKFYEDTPVTIYDYFVKSSPIYDHPEFHGLTKEMIINRIYDLEIDIFKIYRLPNSNFFQTNNIFFLHLGTSIVITAE